MPALKDPSLLVDKNYINGEWIDSESNKTFTVTDPATGELIGTCPESTTKDAQAAIDAAATAFPAWRSLTGRERSRILRRFYELVIENKADLATIIAWENGKALPDANVEVMLAAGFLEWFAEEAPRIYGDVVPHSAQGNRITILKEPVGVCGLITPWNFPLAMLARKIGPALATGCTTVVKTDGETPYSGNAMALLGERAGVPKGVINVVTALNNTPAIGELLCQCDTVRKISFTGSTRVGKILMKQSGDSLKKLSLELGGNAPFIVFEDADLDVAVTGVVASKFKVSGQTCVCANRIYVHESVYDEFTRLLVEKVNGFKVGHSFQEGTTHGPLIGPRAIEKVSHHVQDAVSRGAKVAVGGQTIASLGPNFFQPTVLTDVDDSMAVAHEETFGPIAPLFRFSSEEEVVDAANKVDVGLASYIFTNDHARVARVTETLEFGMVAVNTGVIGDTAAPFGGIKHSGFGREGSKYGVDDYLQLKTVVSGGIYVKHRVRT
ncbi:Succinate-semialdehyde dehydrogenase [Pleurostoma richardsiae]|uniref:Succinate-semialdehyde dehydrogenase n=1 Tax=Pleurostoma richardsiae TaxID=41990 RepID=A0AA38S6Z3_9PEZI|nr:Succinate-semialdehyde dehydrogenase [Pleurostoma richardsiae]